MAGWEWMVVGMASRVWVVAVMIIGMAPALAVMEGVGIVGGGVVEVVVLVVVGCVVVVRACEVVVVWVVDLWAAGEYRGVVTVVAAGIGVWLGIGGVVVVVAGSG